MPNANLSAIDSIFTAFAWVGAFMFNAAFGGLVALCAPKQWILGCILLAVYTTLLFGSAVWFFNGRGREHTILINPLFLLALEPWITFILI